MSQRFIEELRNENLSNHLVLPLLKLNKFSFPSSNLVNTYLDPEGRWLFVVVVEKIFLSRRVLDHHPNYSFSHNGIDYFKIAYTLKEWEHDIWNYIYGRFSHMTTHAKEYINRYRAEGDDYHYLQGVNRDKELKEMWEREIGDIRLKDSDELLSKPGKTAFMTLREFFDTDSDIVVMRGIEKGLIKKG